MLQEKPLPCYKPAPKAISAQVAAPAPSEVGAQLS